MLGMPLVPSWPWYTWLATTILSLLALGMAGALLAALFKGCGALLIAAWVGLRLAVIRLTGWRLRSFGSAHWAGRREITRAGVLTSTGLPLGTWQGQTLREPSGGHVLLMGPPRSRKSWGLVMPALAGFPGSCVVTDLRSELYAHTHAARERLGPVYRFDPVSEDSCDLNLLDVVRWGTRYEFADVHRIVVHLLPDALNPFQVSAQPLLLAVILHCHQEGHGSFPGVVDWMVSPAQDIEQKLSTLLASSHPLVQAGARRTLDQEARLRSAVWNAAISPLVIFLDPMIARHTTKSEVDLSALHHGLQPLSLFLCMEFGDIARLGTFLGLFVELLVSRLGSPATPPRHPVLLCLDEAANLARLPELERAVSYLQGSGTQILMTFQNLQQVVTTYGEHTPLLASMTTQVHYCPADTMTATALSVHLGDSSVLGVLTSPLEGVQSAIEHARPLLTVGEVLRLGDDEAVILTKGHPPIRATKLGVAVPPHPRARLAAQLQRHPAAWATLVAGLLLTLALWPLWWGGRGDQARPAVTSQAVQPDRRQAVPPPPGGPWVLSGRTGTSPPTAKGRYPTADQCQTAMHARFDQLIAMAEALQVQGRATVKVDRQPQVWRWSVAWPNVRPTHYEAACRDQPE